MGQKKVYGLSVNETAFFTCHVEADPPAFSFRWSFNNSSAGQEVLNYNSTAGLKSIAYFTPKEKRDYSSLYCWGRNHIGIQREPCVFSLVFISPPEPLKNCTISNTTAESIHLECVAGYDGGLQQYFFLEVYNAKLERLTANITSNSKPEFHVFELLEGSRFILLLYSANTKGKSSPVVLTAKTKPVTQNYVEATSSLLLNPLVGVLIGTVVSLILITIIITVIIRLRSYDDGKDDTPDQMPTSSNELQRENIPENGEQDSKDPDIIPTKDDWNYLPKRKQGKSFCEILVPSEQSATVHTRQKNYAGVPKESTNNNPLEVQKNCGCHSSYRNCCIAEFSLVTKEPSTQRNSTGCNTLSTFQRPSGENVSADYTFNCNSSGFSSTPRIRHNKQRKFISTAV
ncbi:uncharacterized protein LOC143225317 [Tachypleus tridentatus]|uniref:uncharacterized protein LOC143225317 n=1 Tax=Tachypleus tridentatus TaxID=6853 RepID=UPI003FD309A9